MRCGTVLFFLLITGIAWGQASPVPNPATEDTASEIGKLKNSCGAFSLKALPDCVEELFTGQPLHVAVGSIAPQNGFAGGLAYVGHKNTDNWRISYDADAVASNNASWRAGVYLAFVHSGQRLITHHLGSQDVKPNWTELPEHSVLNVYAQAISLNKLTYFGLGPATTEAGRTFYGMREIIVGGNAIKPFYEPLKLSLYGEMNGRFVALRPSDGQPSPSVEQLYTNVTAPGLASQPGTLQFGEGLRMTPVLAESVVRLNYSLAFQEYIAPNSTTSFERLTVDLGHQFALYGKTTRVLNVRAGNGPDDCSLDPGDKTSECPKAFTRNLEGSVGVRVFTVLSMTPSRDSVPFYFQPTLGGSDINGNASLASYQDYRFRAPNVLLLQQTFEHSIWKYPVGFMLAAEEGKLSLTRGDLANNNWLHSFSVGLTLRAGGLPEANLLFSWGGSEGTHTIANVNTALLGGSLRPLLY